MREEIREMSLDSTFAWIAVAVAASLGTLALIQGYGTVQTVALSAWPFAT